MNRTTPPHRRRAAALAIAVALAVSACGGSDDEAAPSTTAAPTTTVVETTTTAGFRFHVVAIENRQDGPVVAGELPAPGSPPDSYPVFRWPDWDEPAYRLEPKHSYPELRRALGALR